MNQLPRDTVDAIVDEFVKLNGRRVQSYYHLGFRDVLFGRPPATSLPASNADRLRWYFSGYIVGLERHRHADRILELFDDNAIVKGLGDTGLGPSKQAAPFVFNALVAAERHAEAAEFVGDQAALRSEDLDERMLEAATALLRRSPLLKRSHCWTSSEAL